MNNRLYQQPLRPEHDTPLDAAAFVFLGVVFGAALYLWFAL